MTQATERFSSRVDNYIRYRPGYPPEVVECLCTECGLTDTAVIADVGSGTGILAELFLRRGSRVYGVEPNREMREAGERLLQPYPQFQSVNGSAEDTTLAPASVDFVLAAQAFHWFDRDKAKAEFKRILKVPGWEVLVWNERCEASTPFACAYERLLRDYATDYEQVNYKQIDETVLSEFFRGGFQHRAFENRQDFDYEGLKGRLLSSSYAPETGHPRHAPMLAELENIFATHQTRGTVPFEYETNLYYGHLV